ncbi:GIY-YIG nuclease family protein [Microbacterium sp. NPDC056736]|uniref:GIY-YIG nuclease family protein n=1 Tax=Microbacterium sp. NPDC056736 TaxID=3345932 RepID=UPI0036707C07
MAYMYILQCTDGSLYVGSTLNLEHRIAQHNEGEGAEYTKTRLPVHLLYFEQFDRVDDAYRREKQVQGVEPSQAHRVGHRAPGVAAGAQQEAVRGHI